jgi:nitrogen PTS system EIIA component
VELSTREVAKLLSITEEAVYRLADDEGLPVHRLGDELRVNRSDLLEWATARGIAVSGELFAAETQAALPTLAEALAAGGVVHGLPGTTKAEVLRALVDAMTLPEGTDRAFLLSVLEAREALGSTGIGNGIAIPHPRNPIVLRVRRPIVTLCFLATPVDFAAVDDKPVFALFSLISPTPKLHLHLLSRLAYVLRDESCRATIAARGDAATILTAIERVEATLGKK